MVQGHSDGESSKQENGNILASEITTYPKLFQSFSRGYTGWVGLPLTTSGILGIYKDPNTVTISSCGDYWWEAQSEALKP